MEEQILTPQINKPRRLLPPGCTVILATIGCVSALLLLCIGTVVLGGTAFVNFVLGEYETINDQNIQVVCSSNSSLTQDQYKDLFTETYKKRYSYDIAKSTLNDIFPIGFDCKTLTVSNLVEILSKQLSIRIQTSNQSSTAVVGFKTVDGKRRIEIELEKNADKWQISEILESTN